MKKEKYLVFIDKDLEYIVIKKRKNTGTLYTLKYSHSSCWNDKLKGKIAFKILDDGNSLKILNKINILDLDYLDAEKLNVLMTLIFKQTKDNIKYIKTNKLP